MQKCGPWPKAHRDPPHPRPELGDPSRRERPGHEGPQLSVPGRVEEVDEGADRPGLVAIARERGAVVEGGEHVVETGEGVPARRVAVHGVLVAHRAIDVEQPLLEVGRARVVDEAVTGGRAHVTPCVDPDEGPAT
jgi:hypothetical protein